MPRARPARRRRTQPTVEWIAGFTVAPRYTLDARGVPDRRDLLLFLAADGTILGSETAPRAELLARAPDLLARTIDAPMLGKPHAPTRIRAASRDLAFALRAAYPNLDIIAGRTPELDDVHHALLAADRADDPTIASIPYVRYPVSEFEVACFFGAAWDLYRAAPWGVVADDCLFEITIDDLDEERAIVMVRGQDGPPRAVLIFPDMDHFDGYLDAAEALVRGERGDEADFPLHYALQFASRRLVGPAVRAEIAAHGFPLAHRDAIPCLAVMDSDLVHRPPGHATIALAEAVCTALTRVVTDHGPRLATTITAHEPLEVELTLELLDGDVHATVRVPPHRPPDHHLRDFTSSLLDPILVEDTDDRILRLFEHSERAAALAERADPDLVRFLHERAETHFGQPLLHLDAPSLERLLFDILPAESDATRADARPLIEELRALLLYIEGDEDTEEGRALLRIVTPEAIPRLERALRRRAR